MAKPTNTIGDRDYGRRYYASKKKYEEQRKLASDAHVDRIRSWKERHSEFKKPYLPDLDYPEMEMYNPPPITPLRPVIPPGEPPVIGPVDPGGPIGPPKEPPPRELPPFLGCMFFSRRIRPTTLRPNEIAWGGVDMGSQDSIQAIHIYGPGILGTDINGCNATTAAKFSGYKAQNNNKGFCGISVKAKSNPKDFNHVTPYFTIGKDAPGPYPIIVEVIMGSGAVCTEMLEVEICDEDEPGPQWNTALNSETISANGTNFIRILEPVGEVLNGIEPFTWSVTGTDFSLLEPVGKGRSNFLYAGPNACGTGTVTIVDSCGKSTSGSVRCINAGVWKDRGLICAPGFWGFRYPTYNDIGYFWYIGGWRCKSSWAIVISCGGGCSCGSCASRDCLGTCDDAPHPNGCAVCMDPRVQMGADAGFDTFCSCNQPCNDGTDRCYNTACFFCAQLVSEEWACV